MTDRGSDPPRAPLDAVLQAQQARLDDARPAAVARLHALGRWTAREAIAALSDADSFVEYGGIARPASDPAAPGAADGLVMGSARIDGQPAALVAYDFTVFGGTQSFVNHQKITRMFEHALRHRVPVVCWLDGGGARTHDMRFNARTAVTTFVVFARLSGLVPTVGIVPGRAFAGHANLAGMCDLLVAVRGAAIGLAGPPLVQAALGVSLTPEQIGPADMHAQVGTIDVLVDSEADAVRVARQYLAYFAGPAAPGAAADQARLRELVPANPRQAYDVRTVIDTLADTGSVLELRAQHGATVVTALLRLGGRTVGVVANQPMVQAGAIDADGAGKAARFVQICDAFDLPVLLLCDTPGLLVGPDAERSGLVRESARMLAAIANATVPLLTVVLRKAYGLGYYIMGSQPLAPALLLAWPTAEYGGMGLEGAVNILHKRELEAQADDAARDALRAQLTDTLKDEYTALAVAGRFGYDDVIDPADTRELLLRTLENLPAAAPRAGRKRFIEPN